MMAAQMCCHISAEQQTEDLAQLKQEEECLFSSAEGTLQQSRVAAESRCFLSLALHKVGVAAFTSLVPRYQAQ